MTSLDKPRQAGRAHASHAPGWRNRWVLLAASTLCLALGVQNLALGTFGLFLLPLSGSFGWGRGDTSVGFMVIALSLTALTPAIGVLADRYSVRGVAIGSIIASALVYLLGSLLRGPLWQFYAFCLMLGIATAGTSPMIYTRVIIAHFEDRRGLALGLAMAGAALAFGTLFPVLHGIIANGGWRAGYRLLAALCLIVALPAAWVAFGRSTAPSSRAKVDDAAGVRLAQALKLPTFALMLIGFGLIGVLTGGISAHIVAIASESLVPARIIAFLGSASGGALILGRLTTGALLDRLNAASVAAFLLLFPLAALALLALGITGIPAFLVLVACAFGIGGEADILSYMVSRYFGLRAFNAIFGFVFSIYMVGYSIGPLVLGYSVQLTSSYGAGFTVLTCVAASAVLPFAALRRVRYFD